MPDVKLQQLEQKRAQYKAILDQHPNGTGLTAEDKTQLDTLMTEAKALQTEILADRALEEKKRDFAELDQFLNKPEYKFPHGVGDDSDASDQRKSLAKAGWEIKSGMVYAPTSLGTMQKMWPEQVILGDIPKDLTAEQHEFFRTTRAGMNPVYRKAYEQLILNFVRFGSLAEAKAELGPDERKALSEGTDTAGGFLVPPDIQAELLVRVAQDAVFRGRARVQTTSRDIMKYPLVQAAGATGQGQVSSGGGSIFSSGFIGGWVGEVPTFTDVDAAFGSMDIPIHKIRAATRLSNDFVSDAVVNILGWLAMNGAENMALVEDNAFLNGNTAQQPSGLLLLAGVTNGISQIDVTSGTPTTHTMVNDTTHSGPPGALIDLVYNLPAAYAKRASWLMRRTVEGKIRKYVDGAGRYLWPAMTESGFAQVERTLMGYPVDGNDFMPADGVAGANTVIFGDFSGYIIGQRAQITSTILRERFADSDQVGIILWERVGGAPWNPDAFRIGYCNS